MKVIAVFLCAISAWAAADDDPVEVLIRVRDKVLAHAERIPNHTCVETIARDRYARTAAATPRSCDDLLGRRKRAGAGTLVTLSVTDRLRLDVAIADEREIYSWAGEGKFADKDIDEIVPPGAIGTGPFAATLLGLFQIRDPKFAFEGETTIDGRLMMEFSFAVSPEESHYKVRAGKVWLITGYDGTMLVDPKTADLVRLSVRTAELERATNLCEVDSTMEYGLVHLGSEEYLLPRLTRERYISQDGSEAENTVTFAACREFRGESTVTFGGNPEVADSRGSAGPRALQLPAGLHVAVDLISKLTDEAAAGDTIEGLLAQPIRDEHQNVLVEAGARLQGRLMRVETMHASTGAVTIVLRWETMEWKGVKTPIALAPDRQTGTQRFRAGEALLHRPNEFLLPRVGEEKYGAYQFLGEHLVVRDPLRTLWFTSFR